MIVWNLPSSSVVQRRRPRVLLVEDDPAVRVIVDRQLQALGWETVVVPNGEEAIRSVEAGASVEVLLTDLHLPDLDGVAVACAIAALAPAIGVVFMSGTAPKMQLEPHNAPFLLKPFSTAALIHALNVAASVAARYPR